MTDDPRPEGQPNEGTARSVPKMTKAQEWEESRARMLERMETKEWKEELRKNHTKFFGISSRASRTPEYVDDSEEDDSSEEEPKKKSSKKT